MTAKQNIERSKGAIIEDKWMLSEIRFILYLYKNDVILELLIDKLKERLNTHK
jgi:hypothetical protein